jgi:hypothetical protein
MKTHQKRPARNVVWVLAYWALTIPYLIVLMFFMLAVPYSIAKYFAGGLPEVKNWLIHIQIEGCYDCMVHGGDWTWFRATRPALLAAALGIGLMASRRLLTRRTSI